MVWTQTLKINNCTRDIIIQTYYILNTGIIFIIHYKILRNFVVLKLNILLIFLFISSTFIIYFLPGIDFSYVNGAPKFCYKLLRLVKRIEKVMFWIGSYHFCASTISKPLGPIAWSPRSPYLTPTKLFLKNCFLFCFFGNDLIFVRKIMYCVTSNWITESKVEALKICFEMIAAWKPKFLATWVPIQNMINWVSSTSPRSM